MLKMIITDGAATISNDFVEEKVTESGNMSLHLVDNKPKTNVQDRIEMKFESDRQTENASSDLGKANFSNNSK